MLALDKINYQRLLQLVQLQLFYGAATVALSNTLAVQIRMSGNVTVCVMFGVDVKQACKLISYCVAAGLGNSNS